MDAPASPERPGISRETAGVELTSREASWLAFNERVLDQAFDRTWPGLERLKFLAIHGSNLDEFFMIRVSGLVEKLATAEQEGSADAAALRDRLAAIREVVSRQVARATALLQGELWPLLAQSNIALRRYTSLSPTEREVIAGYFRHSVFPVLTPLAVDPLHPFPFLSNLSLSLAVEVFDPDTQQTRFARVKVPQSLPRFVPLTEHEKDASGTLEYLALEDLIAHNLADLFPGLRVVGSYAFRVTRDMDLDILEGESEDFLLAIDRQLRRRRFGAAVRLEHGTDLPPRIRQLLLDKLELGDHDVYESDALLGSSALFALASLPRPALRDPALVQRLPRAWAEAHDPFALLRERDVLLHHPYDAFSPVLELLQRAAIDADVLAIKMTLYRAGSDSEAVRALVLAAENGKQVAVSIELKARFDEEKNIAWARALERVGAHVFYGSAGLKTHAKALLIVRREGQRLVRYVHLSTGNYNAATARLYTDFALLSSDPELGEDVSNLFNSLSGLASRPNYRKVAVAPRTLRGALLNKLGEQVARAQRGEPARLFAKLNALVDEQMIHELYRASQAGVEIDLVVRGTCCLRPRLPGISERIRVFSMIGRFLEHERVLAFGVGDEREIYLSSADWMPRNLDRRVELLFPVTSEALRQQIDAECLALLALDNTRLYELGADNVYRRREAGSEPSVDAQSHLLQARSNAALRLDDAT